MSTESSPSEGGLVAQSPISENPPKASVPDWVSELKRKFLSDNVSQFILHGNINDYVRVARGEDVQYLRVRKFINEELFRRRDIVLSYDRAAGVRFKDDIRYGGDSQMRHEVKGTLDLVATLAQGPAPKLDVKPGDAFHALDRYFNITLNPNTTRYFIRHLQKRIDALTGKAKDGGDSWVNFSFGDFQTADTKMVQKFKNWIKKLESQEAQPKSIGFLVDYAESLFSRGETLRPEEKMALVFMQKWANDENFLRADMITVVLAENLLEIDDQYIRNPYTHEINIPYPDEEERLGFIQYFFKQHPDSETYFEMKPEILATNTAGLGLVQLDIIMSEAAKNKLPFTNDELTQKKKEMIESEAGGLLEFVENKYNLSHVAGHAQAKKNLMDAAKALKNGRPDVMPMGYLISGPVGTGKTFMISAFTNDIGVPMVLLKNFRGMYVGQSEGNLQKVLKILKAMAPVAVMIDEADAYLGSRSSDGSSGVNSRIFSMLASFMSDTDNRGRIIWFLVTARPDLMPVDFKRQGRAEEHIGLFYPETLEEKRELLQVMLNKTGLSYMEMDEFDEEFFEDITVRSGADMEAALTRAKFKAASLGIDKVNVDIIMQVFNDFLPPTYPEEIELMEYSAVLECTSKELLPERFRNMPRQEVLERVEELKSRIR